MRILAFLLPALFLLCGCQPGRQPHNEQPQGEVIITGQIKNRDFYPHVQDIVLKLPFFKEGQVSYTSPIDKDNSFHFNFQLHAKMCEVSIQPYLNQLYVQPGDSIWLEIDFKDMLRPIIKGNGATRNQQLTRFTEGGYYMKDYRIGTEFQTNEELEQCLEKEYQERISRYEEYVQKEQPTEEVKQYIYDLLITDYYHSLFHFLNKARIYKLKDFDVYRYTDKLQEAANLLGNQVMTGAKFRMAKVMHTYLHLTNKRIQAKDRNITIDEIFSPMKDTPAMPYLYAYSLSNSLYQLNDTAYFHKQKKNFEQYIQSPYLRNTVLQIYRSKKGFQENPKPVSDYILYGQYADNISAQNNLSYMKPFYDLLKKHQGKMIYLDFWTPWCPPCIAEMQPLKELRKKYSPEDIVFISICRSNDRKRFETILEENEMHVPGIEHILASDFWDKDDIFKVYNQLNVESYPYYYIINRENVIVNFGGLMRPSYPGTAENIDKWINK